MKNRFVYAVAYILLCFVWMGCSRGIVGGQVKGELASEPYPESKMMREEKEYADESKMKKSSAPAAPAMINAQGAVPKDNTVNVKADQDVNTEEYNKITENEYKDAKENPLSTFSISVDTASYSNVRRSIEGGYLPPKDAVRIEEMVNYFKYNYPQPQGEDPFSINTIVSGTPWNRENLLVLIGLQGKNLDYKNLKPCNLVFLLDTSGSMSNENKLPLIKKALGMLVNELSQKDKIAVVAYAGSAGLVLPSTNASRKKEIIAAMDKLGAGGSTAGGAGIDLAYKVAKENFIQGGNNRVILCTDGDFNVGSSSTSELVRGIEEKRKSGIYLTICGFGMGNYKDGRMESISKAGNGNYFYIDSEKEAKKVFVSDMRANMFTLAKDVKIQIEFNPVFVKAYRLIGFENRLLANEDFKDDTKDAGELGAGHTVTALYEIVPAKSNQEVRGAGDLKYQKTQLNPDASKTGELVTVKFRYKPINAEISKELVRPVKNEVLAIDAAGENFKWACSVTGYAMLLRDSKFKGNMTIDKVLNMAKSAKGTDAEGYRSEFINMVEKSRSLLIK
jgi:Ca-activated chloride channel family protein